MSEWSLGQNHDFRLLVDHLNGVAVWTASEPRQFEYVSKGFEDIWGIPAEAVKEDISRLIEHIHPDDRNRVQAIVERDEKTVEESFEHRVVKPDGTIRWVHVRLFPIRDEESTITEVVGITTDITEQKRREQELDALNRVIRHDIRNDMTVLLGWAELLEDHVDDSGKEKLQRILATGEHIVEITDGARDYVETVSGESELAVKPMPLCSTVNNELALRREAFPKATLRAPEEPPNVEVHANEMLSSVFRNLLNNAIQHADTDEPVVEIACEVNDKNVVVSIADNGPGVPDTDKEEIFEKGEHATDSSGAGVGLYLVRSLVEQYGGAVWVEDNTPTGAVFNVQLPRAN